MYYICDISVCSHDLEEEERKGIYSKKCVQTPALGPMVWAHVSAQAGQAEDIGPSTGGP